MFGGAIPDDDLLALGNLDDTRPSGDDFGQIGNEFTDLDFINPHSQSVPVNSGGMNHIYSHTPENAPSASPFIRSHAFPANIRQQLQHHHSYSGALESPSSYNASPLIRSSSSGKLTYTLYPRYYYPNLQRKCPFFYNSNVK